MDTHVGSVLLAAQRVAQSSSVKVGWKEKREPGKAVSRATPGPSGLVVEAKIGLVGTLGLWSQRKLHMLWTLVAFQFFFVIGNFSSGSGTAGLGTTHRRSSST